MSAPACTSLEDFKARYGYFEDRFIEVGKCASTQKDVTICYNTFGNPAHPCLLLVQGLGTSLMGYPLSFVEKFVDKGYYVIRYDNRDVGRSTKFEEFASPFIARFVVPEWASIGERCPYSLADMMEDGMGLLTALGIEKAHVFGMSMGGMIVQMMAITHPERVLSLNILFSSVGGRDTVEPSLLTYARFLYPRRDNSIESYVDHMVWFIHFLSQGNYRNDEAELRNYFRYVCEREGSTGDFANTRQIAALMRAPSRREGLQKVQCPSIVMHGAKDPLIPIKNGHLIAELIPNAKLIIYPNLGHDFPPALSYDFAEQILLNMSKA